MISIIICSREKSCPIYLEQNIRSTIGVSYELIWIDNSNNRYSIFEAYEKGKNTANGEVLVFMHDDITFRTSNWGTRIKDVLLDSKIGIVGVLGGKYIDETTLTWSMSGLMAGTIEQTEGACTTLYKHSQDANSTEDVIAIDGLFMAMRKDMFEHGLKWDSQTYSGFHYYDMDLCLQIVTTGYRVVVVNDILITHHSIGAINHSFYESSRLFHQKWDKYLPIKTIDITDAEIKKARQNLHKKLYAEGKQIIDTSKLLNTFPYKLLTKTKLLFGQNPWH